MLKLDFKYDLPVEPDENQHVLTVHYMHGDGDGYTQEDYVYLDGEVDELKRDLLGVIASEKTGEDVENSIDDVIAIFEAQGIEDSHEVADDWLDKFHERDITYGGERAASIHRYDLVYHSGGETFRVDLYINDRKVER